MTTATLPSLYAAYVPGHLKSRAPKTQSAYRSVWKGIIGCKAMGCAKEHVHSTPELPERPTSADWAAWRDRQLTRVRPPHAAYQMRTARSVLDRAVKLNKGVGADLLAEIVAVAPPVVIPPVPFCPPADFFQRAMACARNRAQRAWFGVAEQGPRKGEILGIMPADIKEATRTALDERGRTYTYTVGVIRIERQRGRAHRKNHVGYEIEVSADVLADLRWTIENREAARAAYGNPCRSADGYVFPWSETYLEFLIAHVRESLGADRDRYLPPGKAWHQFRHRMAKDAKDRGESTQKIADRLGDRTEQMARHYSADGVMRNELPPPPRPRGVPLAARVSHFIRATLSAVAQAVRIIFGERLVLQHA